MNSIMVCSRSQAVALHIAAGFLPRPDPRSPVQFPFQGEYKFRYSILFNARNLDLHSPVQFPF